MKTKYVLFCVAVITVLIYTPMLKAEDSHNITSNVVGNFIGFSNLEYSYKIANHLTIGITGSSGDAKLRDIDLKVSSVGIVARMYLLPAFQNDSWYAVVSADSRNLNATANLNNIDFKGTRRDSVQSAGAGYHWFWKSFNISLGILGTNQPRLDLFDNAGNKYKDSVDSKFGLDFNIGGKF